MRLLVALVGLATLIAGRRPEPEGFWQTGAEYHLGLAMTTAPMLTPESRRFFDPISDSVTLVLTVDSTARDTVFGRVDGDTRHFPLAFHAAEGDRFIAVGQGESWRILINPHATDTGLSLDGSGATSIRGTWEPRFPSAARGSFDLRPAT